jgi:hypothetical protein
MSGAGRAARARTLLLLSLVIAGGLVARPTRRALDG